MLPALKTPTLILAAQGDQTVAPGTGRNLYEKLGGSENQFHFYGPEVPHVLSTAENPMLEDCLQRISAFLSDVDQEL